MEQYQGKAIYDRIAIGRLFLYRKSTIAFSKRHIEEAETEPEIKRMEAALDAALARLDQIYQRALDEVGADDAAIFAVHKILLLDKDYLNYIRNRIRQEKVNAEYAVAAAGEHFAELFAGMEDRYMRTRADDIRDISGQLIAALSGDGIKMQEPDEPVVLLANDLAPSETVLLDRSKILAIITRSGQTDSHASYLIRSMGIPAVGGIDFPDDWDGRTAVVDGGSGAVILDPDPDTLEAMTDRLQQYRKRLGIF